MSDAPHEHEGHDHHDHSTNGAVAAPPASGRAASVRLRQGGASDASELAARMDPANQSLADALKICYRLLQVAMVVLFALFLFSGARTVNEGERGIVLRFGKPQETAVPPGFVWAWPYPIGQLEKVDTGAADMPVNRSFIPYVEPGQEDQDENSFPARGSLNPARDGYQITADLNIAHTQWQAVYQRREPFQNRENILPEAEQAIVRNALRRGIIRAVAGVGIDQLLRDTGSLASVARQTAQQTLDDLETGITIEQLSLSRAFPPGQVRSQFNAVQQAAVNAAKSREDARREADRMLNEIAGAAAPVLSSQIDAYEEAVELGRDDDATAVLERIDAILAGQPVAEGDVVYPADLISGEVAEIINSAGRRAAAIRDEAAGDLAIFQGKLAAYSASPGLLLTTEWADAYVAVASQSFSQGHVLPEGLSAEILINADPEIARQADIDAKRRAAEQAQTQRLNDLRTDRYNTQRGVQRGED